jgi:hypothetical protein
MALLCNLPKFYNNLIVAINSKAKVDLNIEFVRARLHVELKKDVEGLNDEASIFATQNVGVIH